jgi:hypothetical protein
MNALQHYRILSYRNFYRRVLGEKITDKEVSDEGKVTKIYRKALDKKLTEEELKKDCKNLADRRVRLGLLISEISRRISIEKIVLEVSSTAGISALSRSERIETFDLISRKKARCSVPHSFRPARTSKPLPILLNSSLISSCRPRAVFT